MVHLPYTVGRQSHDGGGGRGPAAKRSYPPSLASNGCNNGSALSLGAASLLSPPVRASLDMRVESSAVGSAAKARMLWREGFTPLEMENSCMDEREVRRQEVIFELVHTEADYVKDLRIMVDVLQRPMHELRLASAEQIDLVFGNIAEILELHEEINTALMERQRMQYPVVWDISDVLLPFVPRLRIYARYICNQDNALRLVDELRQTSNNFDVFWKERQLRPECRKLPMESFLVLPFQRLLKYPLLLRTLLASTGEHTPQHATARMVAEQIDAWIKKIQDARTKLDSFACLDALSRTLPGVDWAPLLRGEHRLAHSGVVRVAHCGANGALTPDEDATMWLFDAFLVVARSVQAPTLPVRGVASCVPLADARLLLVLGPSRAVEVLELAQCKGSPAVFLHVIPLELAGPRSSIVVRFASKSDYSMWRAKLDAHVRRTLVKQPSKDAADVLADAIARTKLADTAPAASKIRSSRSSSSSGSGSSATDLPTISVRDVYVHFPPPRQRGKLRRGWDFLCSKTEDFTGHGIKRQLRKYGGGGGKRRATDLPPTTAPSPRIISTPILVPSPSPSFVNLFAPTPAVVPNQRRNTAAASVAPGGQKPRPVAEAAGYPPNPRRNTSAVPKTTLAPEVFGKPPAETMALTSYARYSCRNSVDSPPGHRFNQSSDTVVLSPPLKQVSRLELVSATLAYSPDYDEDAPMLSAGTTLSIDVGAGGFTTATAQQ
ncbi:Rho guanine nucleotide exchange factor 3 [Coemansia sp. BCRC 34301]|nr:Rho guanine nucleotide exchange factor 3 [Coemansia sp. BCRC 34301]